MLLLSKKSDLLLRSLKKIEKSKKRDRMDLKELPPKFDYDFLGDQDANPSYCTQTVVGTQEPVHGILQVPKQ